MHEKSALEVWKDALTNVMPHVEVRSHVEWVELHSKFQCKLDQTEKFLWL